MKPIIDMRIILTLLLLFVSLTALSQCNLNKEQNREQTYSTYEKWYPIYDLAAISTTLVLPQKNGYAFHYAVSYTATIAFQELLLRNTDLSKWVCSVITGIVVISAGMVKEIYIDNKVDVMDVTYDGVGIGVGILTFNLKF